MNVYPPAQWQYRVARALLLQRPHAPAILRTTLSASCETLGVQTGCIVMFDEDGSLRHTYVTGIELDGEAATGFWQRLLQQGILGTVQNGQHTVEVRNISTDPRWFQFPATAKLPRRGSAIGIPLKFDNRVLGVMLLIASEVNYFTEETIRVAQEIAELAASPLNNANLLENARAKEASSRRLIEKVQGEKGEASRHEQFRRDLAAMTYHDMRNPLQNIQISLTGLKRLFVSDDRTVVSEMIQLAQHSTEKITRMVKGLLDIERLEQGRTLLNIRLVALDALLAEAVELVRPLAEESNQELCYEFAANLPPLQIDGDMVQRVITNLLENAVKHTPEGGTITLNTTIAGESICISVSDTGPGVPRQFRDEIFDKFFRIKYSSAPSGVGLGLAFCRLAVEAHGGRIWADNDPDGGAVFTFTLPVTAPASASRSAVIAG